ncbi:unnamed protein product [Rhizoctonia solani]|uniref:F-box domain-containing protein n=1 Tax=Rhizoctonia solani TaxID=456999 RepID=A0A8H2WGN5_9AGAM|nr:unnamed protein product [Rhizoctonia solani]
MGACGFIAYRHKGRYYRVYMEDYSEPDECMMDFISAIPRDTIKLEGCWIEKTRKALEDKHQWDQLFHVPMRADGVQVFSVSDSSWILGSRNNRWVYVIDLDNRVFTVNGAVHFRLENLPDNLNDYLWREDRHDLPAHLLKPIKIWPPPRFDTAQAQQTYDQLCPLVIPLSEWGAPTWDTLTVAQTLSASLVETLVDDYTDDLALNHFSSVWHKVGLFCWQVANAAAPCHLTCPALDATPSPTSLHVRASLIKFPSSTDYKIFRYMGGAGTLGRYCWFRGCLVTFCPRLDEPVYVMHQVGQMVQNLRKYGRTTEIGIVMSGWHVVAVAVDGAKVRHSPVLDLHDGKKLNDGFLMLTHLLASAGTVSKAPWRNESSVRRPSIDWILPEEIIQQIVHFTDSETYSVLPFVSRCFRSICLGYPRVGDHILLGYETTASSGPICKGPVFRIRNTVSASSKLARLARTAQCVNNRYAHWRYRAKCYERCVLKPGLVGTFQHLQAGTGPLERPDVPLYRYERTRVMFRDVIKGDKFPEMRIQALDGLWEMIRVEDEGKFSLDGYGLDINGIHVGEHLGGFDKDDWEELSEVETDEWWVVPSVLLPSAPMFP